MTNMAARFHHIHLHSNRMGKSCFFACQHLTVTILTLSNAQRNVVPLKQDATLVPRRCFISKVSYMQSRVGVSVYKDFKRVWH